VPIDVMIELPSGGFFSTVIRDLSTSGAFVLTKRTVEIGIVIAVDLKLPDPKSLKQTTLRASAKVCRWTALGWGIAFIAPSPELIAAIRRLR
jgi:PilZ domain-containing protein